MHFWLFDPHMLDANVFSYSFFTICLFTSLFYFFTIRGNKCGTCFGINREVGLAMQDAVHHPGAVPIGGVICVCGCHLRHIRPCGRERVGRRIDFDLICFLVGLKSQLFEVHQFTEQSHLTLMNEDSQMRKLQLIPNRQTPWRSAEMRRRSAEEEEYVRVLCLHVWFWHL